MIRCRSLLAPCRRVVSRLTRWIGRLAYSKGVTFDKRAQPRPQPIATNGATLMPGKDQDSSTHSPGFESPGGPDHRNQPPGSGEPSFATPSAMELGAAVAESETAALEAELGASWLR